MKTFDIRLSSLFGQKLTSLPPLKNTVGIAIGQLKPETVERLHAAASYSEPDRIHRTHHRVWIKNQQIITKVNYRDATAYSNSGSPQHHDLWRDIHDFARQELGAGDIADIFAEWRPAGNCEKPIISRFHVDGSPKSERLPSSYVDYKGRSRYGYAGFPVFFVGSQMQEFNTRLRLRAPRQGYIHIPANTIILTSSDILHASSMAFTRRPLPKAWYFGAMDFEDLAI